MAPMEISLLAADTMDATQAQHGTMPGKEFELWSSAQVDSAKTSPTTTLRKRFVLSQGNVNVQAASFKSKVLKLYFLWISRNM